MPSCRSSDALEHLLEQQQHCSEPHTPASIRREHSRSLSHLTITTNHLHLPGGVLELECQGAAIEVAANSLVATSTSTSTSTTSATSRKLALTTASPDAPQRHQTTSITTATESDRRRIAPGELLGSTAVGGREAAPRRRRLAHHQRLPQALHSRPPCHHRSAVGLVDVVGVRHHVLDRGRHHVGHLATALGRQHLPLPRYITSSNQV